MSRYISIKRRQTGPLLVAFIVLASLSMALVINVPFVSAQSIKYYADVIRYPLPSIPEVILDGENFTVQVSLGSETVWKNATVFDEFTTVNATLLDSNYDVQTGTWNLTFDLPSGLREGAYSLRLRYKPNGSGEVETLTQPRCLWVLPKWPQRLRILACGDVKPGAGGAPFWYEMAVESNLIDPDLIIFLGDLVNKPISATEWTKFEEAFEVFVDPVYVTAGNHEYTAEGDADIYERIMGPVNYSVTVGDFLLLSLDTDLVGYVKMDRLHWAEQVLSENINKTKIVFFHYPLFAPDALKPLGSALLNITSWENFTTFLDEEIVYPTWAGHPDEAKELFRLIVEYDVRLILSEHIHTDLNVIIQDNTTGKRHYFISPAALAFDIPDHDLRGFKLIEIYANGTLDESTLYYNGTGMFDYPNSIPIDTGTTLNYQPIEPYKIGYLEYYYAPANDGQHHAVSFKVKNELNQRFDDPRIVFKLPADVSLEDYEWLPYKPAYDVVERDGIYYVILENITIPASSELSFTVKSINDTAPPSLSLQGVPEAVKPGSWICFDIVASDQGWGVDEVVVTYSTDGDHWAEPDLLDLQSAEAGMITYRVWIKAPSTNTTVTVKARAVDFAGQESSEAMGSVIVGTPPPPSYTLSITSSPISGVSFTLDGEEYTTPYSATLEAGNYTVTVPQEVTVEGTSYEFVQWDDDITTPTRTIELTGDTALTIQYEEAPPSKPGIPLWQISIIAIVVIAVAAIALLRRRT